MIFLDFEEPIAKLHEELEKLIEMQKNGDLNLSDKIDEMEQLIAKKREEVYANLTPWQRVQLSRHPSRPYTLFYINEIFEDFTELHGDRKASDDKAIVGGFASLDGCLQLLRYSY